MDHEKLVCYQLLVRVAGDLAKRVAKWPRGCGNLSDQVMRAMTSAVLNLAEGNGKRSSKAERRRFFEICLGSVAEVGAGLDLARAFRLVTPCEANAMKSQLKLAAVKIRALP